MLGDSPARAKPDLRRATTPALCDDLAVCSFLFYQASVRTPPDTRSVSRTSCPSPLGRIGCLAWPAVGTPRAERHDSSLQSLLTHRALALAWTMFIRCRRCPALLHECQSRPSSCFTFVLAPPHPPRAPTATRHCSALSGRPSQHDPPPQQFGSILTCISASLARRMP
mmetsp:Transcript_20520/g.64528  ORF Transcript_20520/g.64528 Transcript_20520/m.64528 type:complete len:168 (+) Transcript_20520:627-1130(+)